jgi:hypothetical protein
MRATMILAAGLVPGFFYDFPCHAQEAAEQLALKAPAEKSAGKDPSPVSYRPFGDVLRELGLKNIVVMISQEEAVRQEKMAGNAVGFKKALKAALLKLSSEAGSREKIDAPGTEIRLLEYADRGERAAENWIFYLSRPERSDNGFFAIIARKGGGAVYEYPASVSHAPGAASGPYRGKAVRSNSAAKVSPLSAKSDVTGNAAAKGQVPGSMDDIRYQAQLYYTNYGANLTFVGYDPWPKEFPMYGVFAKPYSEYLNKSRQIDELRISVREAWERINGSVTASEAQGILAEMKRMGREYNELVGECIKYVRDGQTLYSQGKATFPSLLYNVRLMKGSRRITLYDDKGEKIVKKTCSRSEMRWAWFKFKDVSVCVAWRSDEVKAEVPDYSLSYDTGGDQVYPERARTMDVPPTPAFPEVFRTKIPLQRDQYEMEVIVTCELGSDPGQGWLIKSAKLRKGKAAGSDTVGGSTGANANVGFVIEGGVSVSVNYAHTWNHFRFGEMTEFNEFINKPCFVIKE